MTTRFMMGLALSVALGCGSESVSGGAFDRDAAVDEDRGIDERLPDLIGGASGASGMGGAGGESDAGTDADVIDTDAAIEESEPDAEVDADAEPMPLDSDGDGVLDDVDACEGHDDSLDGDNDTIPDGCDTCPVGHVTSCDRPIWTVELPQGNYQLAEDPEQWIAIGMAIDDPSDAADLVQIAIEPMIDGQSFDMNASESDVEALRALMAANENLRARAAIITLRDGNIADASSEYAAASFDPRRAVVTRVRVRGSLGPYSAQLRFDVHGYLMP